MHIVIVGVNGAVVHTFPIACKFAIYLIHNPPRAIQIIMTLVTWPTEHALPGVMVNQWFFNLFKEFF